MISATGGRGRLLLVLCAAGIFGGAGCGGADQTGDGPDTGASGAGTPIHAGFVVPEGTHLLGSAFPAPGINGSTNWEAYLALDEIGPEALVDEIVAQAEDLGLGLNDRGCPSDFASDEFVSCSAALGWDPRTPSTSATFPTSTPQASTPGRVTVIASTLPIAMPECDACDRTARSFALITGSTFDLARLDVRALDPIPTPDDGWAVTGSPLIAGWQAAAGELLIPEGLVPLAPTFSFGDGTGDAHAVFAVTGEPDQVWRDVERMLAHDMERGEPDDRSESLEAGRRSARYDYGYGGAGGVDMSASMVVDDATGAAYLRFSGVND